MCLLAVINPAETTFSDKELPDFIYRNNDGFGFMRVSPDGTVVTEKCHAVDNFIARYRAWESAAKDECVPFAMHTRMRTHGSVDHRNAHPHQIAPSVFLMHNGVLAVDTSSDDSKSDTLHFIERFLSPLSRFEGLLEDRVFLDLLGIAVSSGNRFVIATPSGLHIVNERAGIRFRGAWFSNTYAWSLHNENRSPSQFSFFYGWSEDSPSHRSVVRPMQRLSTTPALKHADAAPFKKSGSDSDRVSRFIDAFVSSFMSSVDSRVGKRGRLDAGPYSGDPEIVSACNDVSLMFRPRVSRERLEKAVRSLGNTVASKTPFSRLNRSHARRCAMKFVFNLSVRD